MEWNPRHRNGVRFVHIYTYTPSLSAGVEARRSRWRLEQENDPEEGTRVVVVAMGGAGNGSQQNLEGKPNRDK